MELGTTPVDASRPAPAFMLGLPYLAEGALLGAGRSLGAPLLFSANGFSVWSRAGGRRTWRRFRTNHLALLDGLDVSLDSAGFVAAHRYGGYPWSVDDYLDLAAAYPFRWFAAMDYCVEPEVAQDRAEVEKRIRMTARSLNRCIRGADERGIRDRLMPVVQGRKPSDYARCLDLMSSQATTATILGVGSVCRRPVCGPEGVVAVVDRLDRELGDLPIRLHLFGAKSVAAAVLAAHPRVASFDSQAYGVHARYLAQRLHCSKTNTMLADVMHAWYARQLAAVAMMLPHQDAPPRTRALAEHCLRHAGNDTDCQWVPPRASTSTNAEAGTVFAPPQPRRAWTCSGRNGHGITSRRQA